MKKIEQEPIIVLIRDVNGRKTQIEFSSWNMCADVCTYIGEDDKILMVYVGDNCVWCGLGGEPITVDDLTGFFA